MLSSEGNFFELVKHQRAHRQFLDKPVDESLIEQILAAAIRAPSAENSQPWEFVVVRDAAMRAQLGEIMRTAWEGGARAWSAKRLSENLLQDVEQGMQGGIASAPVLIVVCGNLDKALESTIAASVYPAVQNLLLAATALGLGSALTTLATHREAELRQLLALPASVKPMALIPVGYPAKTLGISKRKPLADCVHHERFGGKR